jgi:CubicO group peptidase (beta-lactamase class C family)
MRFLALPFLLGSVVAPLMAQTPPDAATLARRVDSLAADALQGGPLAGLSIVITRGDRVLVAKGYGYADLEHRIVAGPETIYEVGSITKQFTAIAIMQLVEQGKVRLEDDLSKYLPDFDTKGRKISVAQLLNHTSGLKNYTALGMQDTFRLDLSTKRMTDLIAAQPPDFAPGTDWDYTNSGFFLAGLIVEKVSGLSYAEYLKKNVFDRVGLTSTSYCDLKAIVANRAKGYEATEQGLVNADPISMTVPYAAGALCSSALDLAAFQRALVSGRIVSRASYQRMAAPAVLKDGWKAIYGLGLVNDLFAGQRMVGHGGQINGFWSVLYYYPASDLTIVLLSNVNPAGGKSLWTYGTELGMIALGTKSSPIQDLAVPAALLAKAPGKYSSPAIPFELSVTDGKLFLAGLGPEPLPIKRQADGAFRADWDPFFELRLDSPPPAGGGCRIKGGGFAPLTWKCVKQ